MCEEFRYFTTNSCNHSVYQIRVHQYFFKVEVEDNNGKLMTFDVALKGTGTVDLGTIQR